MPLEDSWCIIHYLCRLGSKEKMKQRVKKNTEKNKIHKVVVTHHCPSARNDFNSLPGGALNSAFQVDLDAFIERSGADGWIYGHTHYDGGSGMVIGDTRLLCNQLGYVSGNEHLAFAPDAVFEV